MSETSEGIPFGNSSDLMGLGEFLTPGIGISLALEKVAQFGAQCSRSALKRSESKVFLCLKTHLPLNKSHGSSTHPKEAEGLEKHETVGGSEAARAGRPFFTGVAVSRGDRPSP